jgi:hypothetical protein
MVRGNVTGQKSLFVLTGDRVPYEQLSCRSSRRGDANMTVRHLWQMCANICQFLVRIRGFSVGSKSYRQKLNISRRTLSGRMSIVAVLL